MTALRIVIIVLLTAAASVAVTGWIVNIRHGNASLHNAYYPAPSSPAAPLGDVAGAGEVPPIATVKNPLANDASAVNDGHKLFMSMNCAGCHGYGAKGGMGPNLTDTYWRYGGTPERIYQSILNGRPKGMPQWGATLPRRSIWQLVELHPVSWRRGAGTTGTGRCRRRSSSGQGAEQGSVRSAMKRARRSFSRPDDTARRLQFRAARIPSRRGTRSAAHRRSWLGPDRHLGGCDAHRSRPPRLWDLAADGAG